MPRKPIPSREKQYTAEVGEPFYDPDTGVEKVRLTVREPEEEAGPHRGRPRRGSTRVRASRGRASKVTKKWAYVDAESMSMLDLTRQEFRVFTFMMGKMDQPAGEIRVTGAYIARTIGMTEANVSKTLKSLRERLIIIPEGLGIWRMNSWIAYMGEYKKWYPAAMDDEEPYWTQEELDAAKGGPVLTAVK